MRYRLQSGPMVFAPGLIAWAINGYHFKRDQAAMLRVVTATWGVPKGAAKALLSKQVPYTVEEEAVVFEIVNPVDRNGNLLRPLTDSEKQAIARMRRERKAAAEELGA